MLDNIPNITLFNTYVLDPALKFTYNDKVPPVKTTALSTIEKCVKGYSTREGFGGKLAGLFYRIWNAIKAIFGQSDWQKARKAVKILDPSNPAVEVMFAPRNSSFQKLSKEDKFLKSLVAMNENKTLSLVANAHFNPKLNDEQKAKLMAEAQKTDAGKCFIEIFDGATLENPEILLGNLEKLFPGDNAILGERESAELAKKQKDLSDMIFTPKTFALSE